MPRQYGLASLGERNDDGMLEEAHGTGRRRKSKSSTRYGKNGDYVSCIHEILNFWKHEAYVRNVSGSIAWKLSFRSTASNSGAARAGKSRQGGGGSGAFHGMPRHEPFSS